MPENKRKRTVRSRSTETSNDEERRTVRKKRKKRRRGFGGFILLLLILLCSGIVIMRTSLFDIEKITVKGNAILDEKTILSACKLYTGENIFSKSSSGCEEEILRLPYVHSVEVQKKYPSEIIITVKEEGEYAVLEQTGKDVICDRYGKSIRLMSEDETENFVKFTGCREGAYGLGEYINLSSDEETEIFRRCLSCITDYEFSDVTKVDMSDIYNIVFIVGETLEVRIGALGDEDEFSYKMAYIKEVIDSLPGNISGIIDATNPDAGVSYRTGEFEYDPAKGEIENIDSGEENEENTEDMRIISEIITDSIAITSGEETQQKTENTEEIS